MKYINPPAEAPANIFHRTFYSEILGCELGYNIYLPDGYEDGEERYPAAYHLHGWMGDESSDIRNMERVCRSRNAITVFPNNSPNIEDRDDLPMEDIVLQELIPHIDARYRTQARREGRMLSGFSMGGGMAFVWAVKHTGMFSAVTAYAGTYHHYYHPDYRTVGVPAEKAGEIYRAMVREGKHEKGMYGPVNVIKLVSDNADKLRGRLSISLHVGTEDVLYCDNEIMRLHLEALNIPHEYLRFEGAAHELGRIV